MVAGHGKVDDAHQRKSMIIPREEGACAGPEPVLKNAGSAASLAAYTECGVK